MKQRIAITGSGIICAIGTDKKTVSDALVARKSGIQGMKYLPSCHKDLLVGEVKQSDEELKISLGIRADKIVSRTVLLGAYAVRQALDDAGLKLPYLKTRRVCFISGTTVGGMDVTERFIILSWPMIPIWIIWMHLIAVNLQWILQNLQGLMRIPVLSLRLVLQH